MTRLPSALLQDLAEWGDDTNVGAMARELLALRARIERAEGLLREIAALECPSGTGQQECPVCLVAESFPDLALSATEGGA